MSTESLETRIGRVEDRAAIQELGILYGFIMDERDEEGIREQTGEGSANIQAVLIADDALGWKRMDRHRTRLPRPVAHTDGRWNPVVSCVGNPRHISAAQPRTSLRCRRSKERYYDVAPPPCDART